MRVAEGSSKVALDHFIEHNIWVYLLHRIRQLAACRPASQQPSGG